MNDLKAYVCDNCGTAARAVKPGRKEQTMSKITTLKGDFEGTMLECLQWQAEMQGAMPEVDGIDISDIEIALPSDPHREAGDLTPEQALDVVQRRIQELSGAEGA